MGRSVTLSFLTPHVIVDALYIYRLEGLDLLIGLYLVCGPERLSSSRVLQTDIEAYSFFIRAAYSEIFSSECTCGHTFTIKEAFH